MPDSMRWPRPEITRSTLRRPALNFEHFLALICRPDVFQCPEAMQSSICNIQFAILMSLFVLAPLLASCSRSPAPPALPNSTPAAAGDLAPTALALSPSGQNLYIACAAAK